MNFEHFDYLPFILGALLAFILVVIFLEKKFFRMVKTYWFYNRSIMSYLSTLFLCLGMGALLISLLDFRGPEERIKTPTPVDRTIVLIDTSASMLAEDVKPSRLQKAALMAKHFARKAAGQQISIVAFAEIQKKIVPFTNDLDLIDARLDSVKSLRNQNGSSALSVALQESVQYFKETGEARGNILVFTDGEETAESIDVNIPKDIRIALVGIGTENGGRIPLDDGRGFRYGYKKNKGQDIITKLNEGFFKKMKADIPQAQYWLANTYSLPSEEILEFFRSEKAKSGNEQDMVVKPVLMEWIVIPAVLLLILSYLFKAIRIFSFGLLLIVMPIRAQDEKEKEIEYTPEIISKMQDLQDGELNQLEKIKLADDLQKLGAKPEAIKLYEESLPVNKIQKDLPPEAYLNYGTALLEKGEGEKGLAVYDSLIQSLDGKSEQGKKIQNMIEKNITNFFQVQEQKEKEKKEKKDDKKDNKDNKDEKDEDKDQKDGQGEKKEDSKGKSEKDKKEQEKKEAQDKKDQEKKDQEGKDEKKEDEEGKDKDEQNKKENEPQDEGEKKPLPPKKIPAKLKQLMSDDRQLQLKVIENGTKDLNKRKSRDNKDW